MKKWMVLLMGVGLVLSAGAVSPPTAGQDQLYYYSSFEGLGGHTADSNENKPFSVSADGTTVVGNNNWGYMGAEFTRGYVWKQETGMVPLTGFPIPAPNTGGGGVNYDGTIIAGCASTAEGIEACRWTLAGGAWVLEAMGDLPGGSYFSNVWCMSSDGSVSVGFANSSLGQEACRWTLQLNDQGQWVWVPQALGDLPTGPYGAEAYGCSADGSTVVGRSAVGSKKTGWGNRAFRWTSDAGMVDLGVIGTRKWSEARGCSADGSVIVGHTNADYERNQVAFRWTAGAGMVSLGLLPGGKTSQALGVSPDGSVVVGQGSTRNSGDKAFIWDATNGMRRIDEVLAAHGVSTYGWKLFQANAVATPEPGVIVIVGEGINPSGYAESWRAVIFQ